MWAIHLRVDLIVLVGPIQLRLFGDSVISRKILVLNVKPDSEIQISFDQN